MSETTILTDASRIRIPDKRSFPFMIVGTCAGQRARYGDHPHGQDLQIDYCWLNAEAMVIDGRATPDAPHVPYGAVIDIDGYGEYTVARPGPYGGDSACLEPHGRQATTDQERALDRICKAHPGADLHVTWATARVPDTRMAPGEGVQHVQARPSAGRWENYHVYPDGTVRRVVSVGNHGKHQYADVTGVPTN